MKDESKTRKQLVEELSSLRQQVFRLEESEIEHRRIQSELEKIRQRFLMLSLATDDVIHDWDFLDNQLWCNVAMQKNLGVKEIIDDPWNWWVSRLHPADRDRMVASAEMFLKSGKAFGMNEYWLQWPDGQYAFILHRTYISRDHEGKPVRMLGVATDITKRRQMEGALRESEEKYRLLFESAGEGILIAQGEQIKFVNPALVKILGYPEDIITARPFVSFIHPDDRKMVLDRHLRRMKGEAVETDYPFRVVTSDGKEKWLLVNSKVISWEGAPASLSLLMDITKRKQAEEMLRDSEERFRAFMDNMRSLVIIKDKELRPLFFNRRFMEMFPGKEWLGKIPEEIFPPEIACLMRENDLKALSEGFVSYEEEWTDKDGSLRFLETRKFCIDQKDKAPLLGAIITDITDRKQAFEALQRSEQDYRSLFENANDAIFIVQDDRFKFSNSRITNLLGYTLDELAAVPFINLIHPDDRSLVMETHQKRMRGELVPEYYCFKIINKQGKARWVEANAVIVAWKGRPAALAFLRDITERKQVEKQLKRHHDNLEELVRERAKINDQLRLELVKRKRAESALKEKSKDLKNHVDKLVELNSALKFLLKQREEDKGQLEEKVILNVKELLLPYLEELKKSQLDAKQKNLVSILESNLNEIISPFAHKLSSNYYGLTPREIEIANLIRRGKSTKDIANIIGISNGSIIVHRNHIRKKLGIISKKINLRSHLMSLS